MCSLLFFQELSCRGFQQTRIERLLTSNRRTQVAILLSAAQLGVVHLHYSFRIGLISFVGAVLFGFLYARHRTIIGITIAHYILGQIIFGSSATDPLTELRTVSMSFRTGFGMKNVRQLAQIASPQPRVR